MKKYSAKRPKQKLVPSAYQQESLSRAALMGACTFFFISLG